MGKELDLGRLGIPEPPIVKPKIEVLKGAPDYRRKDIDWEGNIAIYVPSSFDCPQIKKVKSSFIELETIFLSRADEVRRIVSLIKDLRKRGHYELPIELFVDGDVRLIISMDEITLEDRHKKG